MSKDLIFYATRVIDVSIMTSLRDKTLLKIERWKQIYGCLDLYIETQINNLVLQFEKENKISELRNLKNKDAVIIREYQGNTYTVEILDKGYLYEGKYYRSLSSIANKITNSHCNGKKFFGVI